MKDKQKWVVPGSGKAEIKYVTIQDIVIPAGSVFVLGPAQVQYHVPHFVRAVAFGPDFSANFILAQDAILEHEELFTKLEE